MLQRPRVVRECELSTRGPLLRPYPGTAIHQQCGTTVFVIACSLLCHLRVCEFLECRRAVLTACAPSGGVSLVKVPSKVCSMNKCMIPIICDTSRTVVPQGYYSHL